MRHLHREKEITDGSDWRPGGQAVKKTNDISLAREIAEAWLKGEMILDSLAEEMEIVAKTLLKVSK